MRPKRLALKAASFIAAAALLGNVDATSGATLLLCAFIGVAIAIYDYTMNVKIKSITTSGGDDDGI